MSEADESSYYEIALTNRQVLGGFVILLACMLAAFFSGVWVGRGGVAGAQPGSPVAQGAPETEDAGLDSFRFAGDSEQEPNVEEVPTDRPGRPAQGGDVVPANPETTLAQDVGAGSAPPPPTTPNQPPRREPPVVAEISTDGGAAAVPRGTARRPDQALGGEELFVQVFSTHDEAQARKVLRRLLDGRLKAFLSPAEVGNKTAYRVRIGPFDSREEAERVARKVQQAHKLDTWITTS